MIYSGRKSTVWWKCDAQSGEKEVLRAGNFLDGGVPCQLIGYCSVI